ncbi:biotin transporter BioY [Roseospira visakhapatnamensis]|uniref:Biotin transporter n=1 Tax=Roseospira visakhapatnamensis TaxID=390880 RepID=A0A7W6RC97_9PROT|nr:biotin transporter BioY [Roseospira visakhapatnamensis]MBB4265273.1 biotin transport system substrate-specific component [Roseospira visakhapatnamensis]
MQTKDIVYIALFAALTAALGLFPPLAVPVIAVPITAQSMGPMLAGGILGAKRGALALVLLLVLVALGLPLLAGGRGGFGVFLGPTGGFMIGWVVAAFVIGWLFERYWSRLSFLLAVTFMLIGGVAVVYLFGILWLVFSAQISVAQATLSSMAFIPGDIVKAVLAALVALVIKRSYPLIGRA